MQSSLNPHLIHLSRWVGCDAHLMRIGFQVDSCEHDKPDWMYIWCASQCPCERAFRQCECDCWLLVHSRLSIILSHMLVLVHPAGSEGQTLSMLQGVVCYSCVPCLIIMHIHNMQQLGLHETTQRVWCGIIECQQMQVCTCSVHTGYQFFGHFKNFLWYHITESHVGHH